MLATAADRRLELQLGRVPGPDRRRSLAAAVAIVIGAPALARRGRAERRGAGRPGAVAGGRARGSSRTSPLRRLTCERPGAHPSVFLAFAAGLVSFLSPCVLPLVPGYLSTVSGLSPDELREHAARVQLRGVLVRAGLFVLSFTRDLRRCSA